MRDAKGAYKRSTSRVRPPVMPLGSMIWAKSSDFSRTNPGLAHGFLRDAKGAFTTIDVPGAISTQVFGINATGKIRDNSSTGAASMAFCGTRRAP